MGENTAIEWADNTINFFLGCTKVSSGCENCYMFRNLAYTRFDPHVVTKVNWNNVDKKLKSWKPSIIFTNSMSDTFHESISQEDVKGEFDMMAKYDKHQFIVLTKRINRAYNFFKTYPCPDNVWIGTSVENKASLHRLEKLRKIHARIKFLSCEPLLEGLGQINLDGIQWVIVGGESDFKAPRPFDVKWAKEILSQCSNRGISYFFKQTGGRKKIDGHWGSDEIEGVKYQQMPMALTSKPSQTKSKPQTMEAYF